MIGLCVVAVLAQDLSVEGLRPGERVVQLAPVPVSDPADHVFGRVVDAHTGMPVDGAAIETWTEEITRPGAGFRRVGESRSGPDGGFRVRVRDGALAAEKARVRAPGYLSFPGVAGDLDVVRLMPRPAWSPRVRVVDLVDRPIPGALLSTTYSCAHDLPAFQLATDALGAARLDELGLQDHAGDLRVRAEGYGTLKYVAATRLPPDRGEGAPNPIRLARRRGLRFRLLDGEGRPLVGVPVHVTEGDGHHVPFTDGRGGVVVRSPYDGREATVQVLRDGGDRHVFTGRFPRDREVALRVDPQGWPDDEPLGTVAIDVRGIAAEGERPRVDLYHEDGWATSIPGRDPEPVEVELPAGEVLVAAGGSFSGWEPRLLAVGVAGGERTTAVLELSLEPRLTVLPPDEDVRRVVVEAGEDSIELTRERARGEPVIPVPVGVPITVLCEGETTRRVTLPPLSGDATADLRPESCALPPSPAERAAAARREELFVRALDPDGRPLDGTLTLRGPGRPVCEELHPGELRVEGPVGHALAIGFAARGYAECWTSVWLDEGGGELALRPTPLASLAIEADPALGLAVLGPEADELSAVHPGPLELVLCAADGRRAGVSLVLLAGERRVLRVR